MKLFKQNAANMITFANMSLGILAILLVVNDSIDNGPVKSLIPASILVMIAALTDRFDGKVARMLNTVSDLGKELDSLSDLVSFGLAPAIIAWKIALLQLGPAGYIAVLIFPMAGAFRLARYNITKFDNVFCGCPITIAGAFLTLVNIINTIALKGNHLNLVNSVVTCLLMLFLSWFMVSKVRLRKV